MRIRIHIREILRLRIYPWILSMKKSRIHIHVFMESSNPEECVPSYPCLFCISILNLETSKGSKTRLSEELNWHFGVLVFEANIFIANYSHVLQFAAGYSTTFNKILVSLACEG